MKLYEVLCSISTFETGACLEVITDAEVERKDDFDREYWATMKQAEDLDVHAQGLGKLVSMLQLTQQAYHGRINEMLTAY